MNDTLKKFLIYGGIGLVALLVAFAVGRYTVPSKVEVKTVETQVVVEKVDTKRLDELTEQVKLALTKVEQLKKSLHREKTKTTYSDGRIEEKEVTDINVDRTVQTTQVKEVEKQVVVVQEKVVTVEKQVVVEKDKIVQAQKPDWLLGVMGGVSTADFPTLKLGLSADRRIAGPVFFGVWGMSDVPTRIESKLVLQGGVKLGLEF